MMPIFQLFLCSTLRRPKIAQKKHSKNSLATLLSLLCVLVYAQNLFATNFLYEYEASEILKQQLPANQIVWLSTAAKRDTLALLKKSEALEAAGAVIILPDLNHHPDWPQMIHPMRRYFPRFGWATLSIQTPVDIDTTREQSINKAYETVKLRIIAAINYLVTNSAKTIILLGRGHSAHFAVRYAAEHQTQANIDALVFVSAFDDFSSNTSNYMKSIAIPMLDIFAEKDDVRVLSSAQARLVAARFAILSISDL